MDTSQNQLPNLPCLCASLRRASRALTQLYDEAVRPLGLRGTQFTVLQALSIAGEVTQGRLGEILAIDSTTLTRTLAVMRNRRWIETRRGRDGRERLLKLSKTGWEQLDRASPAWQGVQDRLRSQVGDERWGEMFRQTGEITSAVNRATTFGAKGETL
jgi:DNA-binding MarR family transcriptional regulator